jgi:uncharacterized protein YndB with AHSA1/START domain
MTKDRRTDRASRLIDATPDALYAALTSPEALIEWLPPEGMTASMSEFDLRPGGRYRMTLHYDDRSVAGKSGGGEDVVAARFVDLKSGEKVVQAVDFESDDPDFAGTMVMSWILTPEDGRTRIDIIAEGVPPGISAEDHATGLRSSLDKLAAYMAKTR